MRNKMENAVHRVQYIHTLLCRPIYEFIIILLTLHSILKFSSAEKCVA